MALATHTQTNKQQSPSTVKHVTSTNIPSCHLTSIRAVKNDKSPSLLSFTFSGPTWKINKTNQLITDKIIIENQNMSICINHSIIIS